MKVVQLGDVCRFEYGINLPAKAREVGDVLVYGSNGPVGHHSVGFTLGQTIVIGRKGSIGEVHLASSSCWPIDTTYYVDASCTDADLEWLAYALTHLRLGSLNKASGVPGLSRDDAYRQSLRMPHKKTDQRDIAIRLRCQLAEVDATRRSAKTQAQDITRIRSRVLQEVFASLQDAPRKVLGDHAPTTSGTTPSRGNKAYWSPAEVPWVKTGEVAFAPITATEEAVSRLALKECSLSLLPPKTVLVAMIGQGKTRGQSALLEIEATTNQNCFAVLPSETWQPEFLYYWFVANYQNLRNLSSDRGGSQSALNGALLKALEVPAPGPDTQGRIVQRVRAALAEVDTMQTASQQMLKDLEQLPQRILAQAFDS